MGTRRQQAPGRGKAVCLVLFLGVCSTIFSILEFSSRFHQSSALEFYVLAHTLVERPRCEKL